MSRRQGKRWTRYSAAFKKQLVSESRESGMSVPTKRLERGRFVWPSAKEGKITLSRAQLSMLLEGIDWRILKKTWRPSMGE